jgi:hypothetical protein
MTQADSNIVAVPTTLVDVAAFARTLEPGLVGRPND